ncbi:MAG: S9 family peptidase [Bacteroidales bacterium]|nr:S9 family peptidase [Bacteroidales bacterium]
MKKYIFILSIFAVFAACKTETTMKYEYPTAKTVDSSTNFFGTTVLDPYRWMENETDSDLVAWIEDENKLTQDFLNQIPYRQQLFDRLEQIFNYEKVTAPYMRGGKYFSYKNNGLQNQYVLFVQDDLQSDPRLLLDPNTLSTDGTVALSTTGVSKDGKYLAYAISRSGSDWNEIYVLDIETGEELSDHIEWVKFSGISWYKNGFYYSRFDQPAQGTELSTANINQKVYYHELGTPQSDDVLIYSDPDNPTYGFGADVSDDQKYLIISVWEGTSGNMLLFKDLTNLNSDFVQINFDFDSDYSFIDNINGKLLVMTNNNAPNYRIIAVDPQNATADNWVDFIAETENVIQSIDITPNNIILEYMEDVKSVLKIYDYEGNYQKDLELPGIGSIAEISANKVDNFIFYKFSSYTTPGTIFKYEFDTENTEVFYETQFAGLDLSKYVVEQVFYPSKDGTKIPMFLVHKKDIELNGKNPTWLYGYGGFNISLNPGFDVRRLLWLENGGVYAVANLRGGGEYGEDWHKQGIHQNKQNVFDDFISAAEYLIDQKYTNSDLLAIQGGSNGGLLVGACANQRPDLFKVALPAVGVMDMLRFQLFTIGRAWSSDYGLAADSKEMFEYLYAYSPIHNVDATKEYPAVLVTTADHDDRVVPAHSFKYIATLQAARPNNINPLFIRIETKAGHGAGKPTEKILQEWADLYAFTFFNMGIEPVFE